MRRMMFKYLVLGGIIYGAEVWGWKVREEYKRKEYKILESIQKVGS